MQPVPHEVAACGFAIQRLGITAVRHPARCTMPGDAWSLDDAENVYVQVTDRLGGAQLGFGFVGTAVVKFLCRP